MLIKTGFSRRWGRSANITITTITTRIRMGTHSAACNGTRLPIRCSDLGLRRFDCLARLDREYTRPAPSISILAGESGLQIETLIAYDWAIWLAVDPRSFLFLSTCTR